MTIKIPIEVDITYVNKSWFSLRKKVNGNDKHYVIGFYRRGIKEKNVNPVSKIIAIPDNKPETIEQVVLENTVKGCILYSQENILPSSLKELYEIHELKVSENVNGDIHINNVNNMWRDLKREIKRVHGQVSQKHLQGYCNEVAWRINNSHLTAMEKFNLLLSNCAVENRKTSYKNLIK